MNGFPSNLLEAWLQKLKFNQSTGKCDENIPTPYLVNNFLYTNNDKNVNKPSKKKMQIIKMKFIHVSHFAASRNGVLSFTCPSWYDKPVKRSLTTNLYFPLLLLIKHFTQPSNTVNNSLKLSDISCALLCGTFSSVFRSFYLKFLFSVIFVHCGWLLMNDISVWNKFHFLLCCSQN